MEDLLWIGGWIKLAPIGYFGSCLKVGHHTHFGGWPRAFSP